LEPVRHFIGPKAPHLIGHRNYKHKILPTGNVQGPWRECSGTVEHNVKSIVCSTDLKRKAWKAKVSDPTIHIDISGTIGINAQSRKLGAKHVPRACFSNAWHWRLEALSWKCGWRVIHSSIEAQWSSSRGQRWGGAANDPNLTAVPVRGRRYAARLVERGKSFRVTGKESF
jgi:hypothetical protein